MINSSKPSDFDKKEEIPSRVPPAGLAPINSWGAIQTIVSVAVIMATLLTFWTPTNLFSNKLLDEMMLSVQSTPSPAQSSATWPTPTTSPRPRIGIVAGHWKNDSGSVCGPNLNNTKEVDVNLRIATLVQQQLVKEGYDVDLLEEFDKRLFQYQSMALVSIHNDSCDFINNEATGYKVAAAPDSPYPEKSKRLTDCMIQRYGNVTGMRYHPNTITPDMTSYHAFNEIHTNTTAAIIETGFLNLDYQKLTTETELIARGVTAGILCYIRNEPLENVSQATNTATQTTDQPTQAP
jgi:N-acetylmuramoyl-L-alanine amidase